MRIHLTMILIRTYFFAVFSSLFLSSCGSMDSVNLNPFDTDVKEHSRAPENALHYQCEENKEFFVRMLNKNQDAWLILPDHAVNLSQSADDAHLYKSAGISLKLSDTDTTLTYSDKFTYQGCKMVPKK